MVGCWASVWKIEISAPYEVLGQQLSSVHHDPSSDAESSEEADPLVSPVLLHLKNLVISSHALRCLDQPLPV